MAIAIGGHDHKQATTGATVHTTAGVATQASGSTFVIDLCFPGSANFTSIVDNKSNTYAIDGSEVVAGGGAKSRRYICQNGVGGAGHTVTLTVSATDFALIYFVEITGAATASLDQVTTAIEDSASPFTSNTTGTTTQANELLLASAFTDTPSGTETITWGNSFTQIDADGNSNFVTGGIASRVVSSASTYQASITSSVATSAVMRLTTFKEAAGAAVNLPRNLSVLAAVNTAANI